MTIFRKTLFILCFLLENFAYSNGAISRAGFRISRLTCEYQLNPLGIGVSDPRLSWLLTGKERNQAQSAYEIIVSDNRRDINLFKGNVWRTGKTASAESILVKYNGKPLEPFTRYFWRVRCYDQNGRATSWSTVQWFETAAFSNTDWKGEWIGDGSQPYEKDEDFYRNDPAPLFRRSFAPARKLASARLYISGLGYYEAYLNGKKIGDHMLDPGWTAYDKEILYAVHDVTPLVKSGGNVLGIMLGNGWYNPVPLRFWGKINLRNALTTGRPIVKAMLRLTYADGGGEVIVTDENWATAPGPIVRNNVYLGEHYDARLFRENWASPEGALAAWKKAVPVRGPAGKLVAQQQPPVRITETLKPVAVAEPKPGVFVFDMGKNFAGVARIRVRGSAGTLITLRYGEDKFTDGSVNLMTAVAGQVKNSNGGPGAPAVAWQEDSYTLNGKGTETWHPCFTFHGFRYVEVTGWPGRPTLDDVAGLRLNSDLVSHGTFTTDNEMFNQLNGVIRNTFLSNVFSVQSDCPAREKFGYGGDLFCTAEAFMYNFDMSNFYRKVLRDFANDQRPSGGITETAPFVGIADSGPGEGSGPLAFQAVFPYLVNKLYEFYGDQRLVEENYPALKKQVEYLRSKAKGNLFDKEDLGDHEALTARSIPLTPSVFYYVQVKLLARFAGILHFDNDQLAYSKLAEEIRIAINQKFDPQREGKFELGTQSAQAISLWAGVPREQEAQKALMLLEDQLEQKGWHISTGIFGTKMLFDVLRNTAKKEIAYRVADQRDFPGWGYMLANGATTLWETWKPSANVYSKNHPMFGSVSEWFYRSVLGINAGGPGFKRILLKPQPGGDMRHAQGTYQSGYGEIDAEWTITNDAFSYKVRVPVNTRAEVWLPLRYGQKLTEQGKQIDRNSHIKFLRKEQDYAIVEVGSGDYSFQIQK